jgi:hypothetical protein
MAFKSKVSDQQNRTEGKPTNLKRNSSGERGGFARSMRPYTHPDIAAEQGPPTAHVALAQLYAARRAGPKDLVQAYMWFLIAG